MPKVAVDVEQPESALDPSDLDENTDTLGRAILRHERDAGRVRSAISDSVPLGGSNMSRTHIQRFQRPAVYDVVGKQDDQVGAASPKEPQYNVPRHWGRRTKPEKNWTRASKIPVTEGQAAKALVDRDTILPHKTSFTGDDYWDNGEEVVAQDTPPSMKRRRPLVPAQPAQPVQPTSLRHMNPRLRDIVLAKEEQSSRHADEAVATVSAPRQRLDLDARARREQLHARLERFRAAQSRNRELDASSDKENVSAAILGQVSAHPASQHLAQSRSAHNRSQSIQMLERLARVTQSPPRVSNPLGELPVEAPTPLITGGWIDTPKADGRLRAVPEIRIDQVVEEVDEKPQPPVQTMATDDYSTNFEQQAKQKAKDTAIAIAAPISKVVEIGRSAAQAVMQTAQRSVTQNPQPVPVIEATEMPSNNALDQHISKAFQAHSETPVSTSKAGKGIDSATREHITLQTTIGRDGKTICAHCGGCYTSVWQGLWYELRNNFYTRGKTWGSVELTPLGTIVVLWLCWLVLETLLCYQFCQPRVATSMFGYGVNTHAPIFPFVLPTLLLNPFAFAMRPLVRQLSWAKQALVSAMARPDTVKRVSSIISPRSASQTLDSTYMAAKRPARWLSTVTAVTTLPARRAFESAAEAINEIGEMW